MDSIVKDLLQEFSFYCDDFTYYEGLVNDNTGKDINYLRRQIINDIKHKWNDLDNDWFIKYLNKVLDNSNPLEKIERFTTKYDLTFSLTVFENILMKCSKLDEFLKKILGNKSQYKEEEIEAKGNSSWKVELLITYALLKNLLAEEDLDADLESSYYSEDSMRAYLNEIGQIPRLSKEQTMHYLKLYSVCKEKVEKETDDIKKKELNQEIKKYRNILVEANLRLVVFIARRYVGRGLDLLELIQEGNEGLLTAIEKYDISKGFQLSTYATWWIRARISRAVSCLGNAIRVPVHRLDNYTKVYRAMNELQIELNRTPTSQEIAEKLNFDVQMVDEALLNRNNMVALEASVDNDDDERNGYNFLSRDSDMFEDSVINAMAVNQLVKYLSGKEELIIRMRFGIANGIDKRYNDSHTLEEVGQELGITRERVRQIEKKALMKLGKKANESVFLKEKRKSIMFWDNFKESERDTVRSRIDRLPSTDKELLYRRFGYNLDRLVPLGSNDNNRAETVIRKLKKMVKNPNYVPTARKTQGSRKNGPIITYKENQNGTKELISKSDFLYEGKTLEEVLSCNLVKIIDLLSDDDRILLKKVLGENLDGVFNTVGFSKEDIKNLKSIINDLRSKLAKLEKKPTKSGRVSKYNNLTLMEILECNEEELMEIISRMKGKSLLKDTLMKAFGVNFLDKVVWHNLTFSEQQMLRCFFSNNRKNKKLDSQSSYLINYNGLSLDKILDCSKDVLKIIVGRLRENTKNYSILTKAFGEDFEGSLNYEKLTNDEIITLSKWIESAKSKVRKIVYDSQKNKKPYFEGKKLWEHLECTEDEAKIIRYKMKKDGENCRLLVRAYGENIENVANTDGFSPEEIKKLGALLCVCQKKLQLIRKNNGYKYDIDIFSKSHLTQEELDFVSRKYFSESEYLIWEKKSAKKSLSGEEIIAFMALLWKTRWNAENYKEDYINFKTQLMGLFNCNCEDDWRELLNLIKNISCGFDVVIKIIEFGENNLSSEEIELFETLKSSYRAVLEKKVSVLEEPVEILTSVEYEGLDSPLKHPFFKEVVRLIPIEYRIVTELRLGLYDGKLYDIRTIAELFNMKEVEVITKIEKGILLFRTIVEKYQELYNQEFPELDGEVKGVLNLIRKGKNNE